MATSQSIEQWKAWLDDAQEYRQDWQHMAERSWQEIKKQQKNGRFWSVTPNTSRKNVKFQLWWSTYKIRQPIYYSRTPIPIGKDTVGNDPVGRTAAIALERLAKAVLKTFDFDRAIESARDDFLVGNLSQTRAFFACDYIKEKEKKRVEQVAEDKIVDEQGKDVDVKLVQQDEDGLYIESEKEVDVENERVWIEPVLYTDFYVDPDAKNWDKARRIAFAFDYPKDEFIEVFGRGALSALTEQSEKKVGKSRTLIRVYECWDSYAREVVWVPECGDDFITPLSEKEIESDLYKLERFYPCPAPLIANAATDCFYPIPEYYELQDLIEEMHLIFSRIMQLCRAIRVRALYDANVAELAPLVNEASEADFIGVPNLAQSLAAGQGNLSNLVAYLNVAPLIEGLNNMYTALEQRVNLFYQLTGISDLLRGQTDPNETYGAQQLKGKFAMNRIADDQRLQLKATPEIKWYEDQGSATSQTIRGLGYFIAVIMAVGAGFAGMNTMYAAVSHRTQEIGTLRVLGFSRTSILLSFVLESMAIAILGVAIGILLALPLNFVSTGTNNFVTFSEIAFNFRVTWDLVGAALIFGAGIGLFGSLLPSIRASRFAIVDALRET